MSKQAEIYCYVQRGFEGNLDPLLECLREKGHRVLVGDDLDELMLLLQVSEPTAVLYTLGTDETALTASFQMASRRALLQSVPMLLVGPGDPQEKIVLCQPLESRFVERQIEFDDVLDIIEGLIESEPPSLGDPTDTPIKVARYRDPFPRPITDRIQQERGEVEIETRAEGGEDVVITTSVLYQGELLMRDEQIIDSNDPELTSKMEQQHLDSLDTHLAETVWPRVGEDDQELMRVSGPLTYSDIPGPTRVSIDDFSQRRSLIIGLVVGAVLFLGVGLAASVIPLDSVPLSRVGSPVIGGGDVADTRLIQRKGTAGGTVAEDSLETKNLWPPLSTGVRVPPRQEGDTREPLPNDATPVGQKKGAVESRTEIPFPGKFQLHTSRFSIRDGWEERRFVEMLKSLPEEARFKVVGHLTEKERKNEQSRLGMERAKRVVNYLAKQGVNRTRMGTTLGPVVLERNDLDEEGKPRNRWVSIIIE